MEQLEIPGFEKVTRLTLEGITYTAQFRRCGKSNCRCSSGDPVDLHGPYWYKRDALGNVGYVGKALPPGVVLAWSNLGFQRPYLQAKLRLLYDELATIAAQIEALKRLQSGGELDNVQRLWIEGLGFIDCLVSEIERSGEIVIQDNGRGL